MGSFPRGDKWSVKFDVRDLGGHLDRVLLVISRLVLIFALPLDFHGRVRVVRSMYLLAALQEASLLASDSLRKLRSSICKMVWSRRQPFALCPSQVTGVYRLLEMVGEGCLGHGPIHLLSASAAEIGFRWNLDALAWARPGSPQLGNLACPLQHFKAAILDAWRDKVAFDLCGRKGFRGGPLLDVHGSLQLLNSSHVKEIRLCFVASWLGVSGMVFFLVGFETRLFRVSFVGHRMVMVIYFGTVHFLLLLRFVKILNFMIS